MTQEPVMGEAEKIREAVTVRSCRICGGMLGAAQIGRRNYMCLACRRAQEREWRKTPEGQESARQKDLRRRADLELRQRVDARSNARRAIRRGKLTRQPCEVCGAEPAEAHHDDYSKPFAVRWLCPRHHREHHLMTDRQEAA